MSDMVAKARRGYDRDSAEADNNCTAIRDFLTQKGWSVNAICAIIGSIEVESGYNPWRWQGDDVLDSWSQFIDESSAHAYGLFQFDPAGKYIHAGSAQALAGYGPNFNDRGGNPNDGLAQLAWVDAGHGGYYATTTYPLSFEGFKSSTLPVAWLTRAWVANFERPADPSATITERIAAASYWFNKWGGGPTPPGPSHRPPYWWIMKMTRR